MGDEKRAATAAATAQHAGIVVDRRIDDSLISIPPESAGVYSTRRLNFPSPSTRGRLGHVCR